MSCPGLESKTFARSSTLGTRYAVENETECFENFDFS